MLAQAEDVSLRIALTIAGYFVLSTPFILLERWLPAPGARPHRAIARDLSACAIVLAMSLPISWLVFDHAFLRLAYALELSDWFHPPRLRPWARIAVALVGTDFTLYWLHRALHARLLWPAHRWHHAPAGLYWLSGMRASFAHNLLYVLNSLVWLALMRVPSDWWLLGAAASATLNNWMHAHIRIGSRRLEWLLVTPRFHRVHHALDGRHHQGNYGGFFSVWDRLFGTFVDPERVQSAPTGIAEKIGIARLIAGV